MTKNKKTLVLGASENPERYSNRAIRSLRSHGHEVIAIGKRPGKIDGVEIIKERPDIKELDTITLYLNPQNQKQYYDYILSQKPKRIVSNPGAENPELEKLAKENGIKPMEACTLVLLSTGQY
jgi:predicted CoA-binding protein